MGVESNDRVNSGFACCLQVHVRHGDGSRPSGGVDVHVLASARSRTTADGHGDGGRRRVVEDPI